MVKLTSLIFFLCASNAFALSSETVKARSYDSNVLLKTFRSTAEKFLPETVLKDATCIATLPGVQKRSFLMGMTYGGGVISCKTSSGWSRPAFVDLKAFSTGFSEPATDYVLVFLSSTAVSDLSKSSLILGGDISVLPGPVGTRNSVEFAYDLKGVLAYQRVNDYFVGADLSGAWLSVSQKANQIAYGGNVSIVDLLSSLP